MKKHLKALSLLCAACLMLTACSPKATDPTPTPDNSPVAGNPQNRDVTVDFVVVGAGAGGLSAATEAARQGKSVILLEKLSFAGGSSALCEGYFWSTESKLNQSTGEGLDKESMTQGMLEFADGHAVEGLIRNICDISTEIMDYILDNGATFQTDNFASSGGIPGLNVFVAEGAGAGLTKSLLKIAEDNKVEIRYESKGTKLIVENGAVKGVTVEDKDGTYNIYAENTILATGGFLQNSEMMDQYMPEWNHTPYCAAGSTGDGHQMAMELGAHMIGYSVGCVWQLEGKNGYHTEGGMTPAVSYFRVNQEGKRFYNEFAGGSLKDDMTMQQTNKRAYCFMDSSSPYVGLAEQGVAAGLAYKADTLEELCQIYDIDTETFMATVKTYNDAKAAGQDDPEFGVPNANMVSMTEGPFYASYYQPWGTNCLMGLEADEFCRLLDGNNQPIPGLYGVGELIIGSVVGNGNYPSCGTCLASGIYGGPIAVRHALGLMK